MLTRPLFSPEHDAFRDTARAFVDECLVPRAEEFRSAGLFDRTAWREAGRRRLLSLNLPSEHGGPARRDYRFNALLAEELSRFSASAASAFGIHADCVAPYLVDLGTAEQKARWLPGFGSGDLVTAIALTEPGGGSDLLGMRTHGVRDGSDWVVNGSKMFITNGWQADLVVVCARTRPDAGALGMSLFAIEAGMAGFTRGPRLDKVGQVESDTAALFFHDVRVPAANVLGEVDRGLIYVMERLPQERLGAAVANTAHARQVLQDTVELVRGRRTAGPAAAGDADRLRLADLLTRLDVTQSFVDQCVLAHAKNQLGQVDAAKAKWWSAQVQNQVIDACVQLSAVDGGDARIWRAWRDARVTRIWAGSNELMQDIIGRDLGL